MGTFEKFTKFRESLQGDELAALDAMLTQIMDSRSESRGRPDGLTNEQHADIEKRLSDPSPAYAEVREVNAAFGRPLPH